MKLFEFIGISSRTLILVETVVLLGAKPSETNWSVNMDINPNSLTIGTPTPRYISDLVLRDGSFLAKAYERIADAVDDFEVRDDDIWSLPLVMKRTASFLGTTIDNERMNLLVDHLSFGQMKENRAVNGTSLVKSLKLSPDSRPTTEFLRNGSTEQWKTSMTSEMIQKFDQWIEENLKNHRDFEL
ncbi:hypothetical protein QAD02_024258 [Eretmocerus hayati]|uniref:Uncharacterized protein n=1 Tax=Eretmocerus hayati TaxID=131215 RepID=A0ACC2PYA0_9HYME|nr:hypothetical protein QAD02_024258 [Eretmocerus hayati]